MSRIGALISRILPALMAWLQMNYKKLPKWMQMLVIGILAGGATIVVVDRVDPELLAPIDQIINQFFQTGDTK